MTSWLNFFARIPVFFFLLQDVTLPYTCFGFVEMYSGVGVALIRDNYLCIVGSSAKWKPSRFGWYNQLTRFTFMFFSIWQGKILIYFMSLVVEYERITSLRAFHFTSDNHVHLILFISFSKRPACWWLWTWASVACFYRPEILILEQLEN